MTDARAESDKQEFIELTSVATLFEAEMKIATLQDAGIRAIIGDRSGDFGSTPNKATDKGIAVLVHRSELSRASDELASVAEEAKHVDWDTEEVGGDAQNAAATPNRAIGLVRIVAITAVIAAIALILSVLFR